MTSISLIIPSYNRAGLIVQTLKSLFNQTTPAKEIIVVDDGSTDGTAEAVEGVFSVFSDQFSAKSNIQNPIFKILRQDNAGPGAARNRGLAEATGEFIHFFDSDDIAAPNKHEVQLRALLETGADIAYGPWVKGRFAAPMADSGWLIAKGGGAALDARRSTLDDAGHSRSECSEVFEGPSSSSLGSGPANSPPVRAPGVPASASSSVLISDISGSKFSCPWSFEPEGPVLQARGLPKGDLVRALLTNWSIVPHACLFRRSILERVGGFPEDIWVGEDQLLFLRCLLAGAKVVHTPGTMVFYRLGDAGKLTESKEGQRRRTVDWGRFLLKAKKEIEDRRSDQKSEIRSRRSEDGPVEYPADSTGERGLRMDGTEGANILDSRPSTLDSAAFADAGDSRSEWSEVFEEPSSSSLGSGPAKAPPARAPGVPASASSSVLISVISGSNSGETKQVPCSATAPKAQTSSPDTRNSLLATTSPVAWFGFRLRAYAAWRDLRAFFPGEYLDLENGLESIWKRNGLSGFRFRVSGFLLRKLGGLKQRLGRHRWSRAFRCEFASQTSLEVLMK